MKLKCLKCTTTFEIEPYTKSNAERGRCAECQAPFWNRGLGRGGPRKMLVHPAHKKRAILCGLRPVEEGAT